MSYIITRSLEFSPTYPGTCGPMPNKLLWEWPKEDASAAVRQARFTLVLKPGRPKLMMDPSDRSTWQRPYRFT